MSETTDKRPANANDTNWYVIARRTSFHDFTRLVQHSGTFNEMCEVAQELVNIGGYSEVHVNRKGYVGKIVKY